jgi:aryl-alcohol dehydrogenase-like predicted oxidoreductase
VSDRWPAKFGRECANAYVKALGELVVKCGRVNQADLCLAYSRAQPWITEVLVGAETKEQLDELLGFLQSPPLTAAQVELVDNTLPKAPADLLHPGKWVDNPNYAGSFNKGFLGAE